MKRGSTSTLSVNFHCREFYSQFLKTGTEETNQYKNQFCSDFNPLLYCHIQQVRRNTPIYFSLSQTTPICLHPDTCVDVRHQSPLNVNTCKCFQIICCQIFTCQAPQLETINTLHLSQENNPPLFCLSMQSLVHIEIVLEDSSPQSTFDDFRNWQYVRAVSFFCLFRHLYGENGIYLDIYRKTCS